MWQGRGTWLYVMLILYLHSILAQRDVYSTNPSLACGPALASTTLLLRATRVTDEASSPEIFNSNLISGFVSDSRHLSSGHSALGFLRHTSIP